MILPSLPTDSLYKFIAVAGAFIFLSSLIVPFQKHYELAVKRAENTGVIAMVEERVARFSSSINGASDVDIAMGEFHDLRARAKATNAALESLQREMLVLRNAGLVLGLLLMALGLSAWYLRVQRYEDRLLQGKQND